MMSGKLSGKGAIVTGASRGIGAATARELAKQGATVVVTARSLAGVERVAAELNAMGGSAFPVVCDVKSASDVSHLAKFAAERLGAVDILINNAGTATGGPFPECSLEDFRDMMDTHATGTFLCMRAVLGDMLERRSGRIVNVASVLAKRGAPNGAAYTAAKHAVLGLTRSVALEAVSRGVTVNCVCPGYVDTDMTRGQLKQPGKSESEVLASVLKAAGQARLVTPDEVAGMIAWLCSDAAAAVTGEAINIDAGCG